MRQNFPSLLTGLSRVSLPVKLIIAFSIVSAITLLQALAVWRNVSEIDTNLRRITEKLIPQNERVGALTVVILRASLETRHAMLMRTPEKRRATIDEIGRLKVQAEGMVSELGLNISSEEGRKRHRAIQQTQETFWLAALQMLPLIEQDRLDEAVHMLETAIIPARNHFLEAVESQKEWQVQLLNEVSIASLERSQSTEFQVLVMSAVTAALGLFVSILFWRHEKLEAARSLAHKSAEAKSIFLATMSHEIRTPMNGILGMLELLEHTELSTQQLDYTKKARGATEALLGIINDILDFSKVEAGKMELDRAAFAAADLLRDLSVLLSSYQRGKDIEIVFDIDPSLPPRLLGDVLRLRQVLLNLAGNGIKFTEHGEVIVSMHVLGRQADTVTLEFAVRDSGIGIAPDKLDTIFQGFSQAESSTSRRFGGTGLGLAISKQLVALMGGALRVTSELGAGSRFTFQVNLGIASDPAEITHAAGDVLPGTLRTLIVDDNPLARETMQSMATALGWQAHSEESGAAALDHLQLSDTAGYDLILMDWRMPDLNGLDTAQRIRTLPGVGAAPLIIMVSAYGSEVMRDQGGAAAGVVNGYLIKPVTSAMLVEAWLEARNTRNKTSKPVLLRRKGERLAGLRLLVVEDNVLNQQVAQELLQSNGANVTIAAGGAEGVEMALSTQPPFDAILMDMQMPDMDGLEATRQIRRRSVLPGLPIIAMTANAMESDRQACLNAGMVDHVSKPIDMQQLVRTILHHTGGADVVDSAGLAPVADISKTPIDEDAIDEAGAIRRLGGNAAFYATVQRSFATEAPELLKDAQDSADQAQWDGAVLALHTLKGLAGTLGAVRLQRTVSGAEAEAKSMTADRAPSIDGPALQDSLDELKRQLDLVLSALPAELRGAVAAQQLLVGPANAEADAQLSAELRLSLQELLQLLTQRNMRSIAKCNEMQAEFTSELGPWWGDLRDAVRGLNFTDAAKHCKQVIDGSQA